MHAGFSPRGHPPGETTMTKLEEYQYLSDLVLQAALWRVDKDEGRVPLELEVLDRMNKLKDELTGDSEKKAQIAIEQHAKDLTYKHKWAADKCRVGNKWYRKSDCVQVPRKDGSGWKWALKREVESAPSEERS